MPQNSKQNTNNYTHAKIIIKVLKDKYMEIMLKWSREIGAGAVA